MDEKSFNEIEELVNNSDFLFLDEFCTKFNLKKSEARAVLKKCWLFRRIETCPECKREIIVTFHRPQKKFCSVQHKKRYYNRFRTKTKTGICLNCGKEFEQYSFINSRFCSISCANLYRFQHKKEDEEK